MIRSTGVRRALRAVSTLLLVVGVLVVLDVVTTYFWQEPVTAVVAKFRQDSLGHRLDRLPPAGANPAERRQLAALDNTPERLRFLAGRFEKQLRPGDPAARIRIPKIGASFVVVFGSDSDSLTKGSGFYPSQPLPGQPGTVAIAALPDLTVAERKAIQIDGAGLSASEYTVTAKQPVHLDERSFLRSELGSTIFALTLDRSDLKAGESARLIVVRRGERP